jgi:hypothetical protein
MCIFCGGACGGIVDIMLPSVVTGASLVVLKVKAVKASRKPSELEEDKQADKAEDAKDKVPLEFQNS